MTRQAIRRQAARTLLLVGEGDAEEMFLRHLKGLFVVRGSGLSVTIKNARGKGAAHVVDFAHRHSLNAAFDEVAALLDADFTHGWLQVLLRGCPPAETSLH